MGKIKDFLSGKKAYLLMVAAIIAAIVGWSEDALTLTEAIAAIWAAVTAGAIRAGITKSGITPKKKK